MTKLYKHVTDGGAEYLADTFIEWKHNGKRGKEGRISDETRICIRLDGQAEILRNRSEDDRAELLKALNGVKILSESACREAYTAPEYTERERRLLWALSKITDAAIAAIQKAESPE